MGYKSYKLNKEYLKFETQINMIDERAISYNLQDILSKVDLSGKPKCVILDKSRNGLMYILMTEYKYNSKHNQYTIKCNVKNDCVELSDYGSNDHIRSVLFVDILNDNLIDVDNHSSIFTNSINVYEDYNIWYFGIRVNTDKDI